MTLARAVLRFLFFFKEKTLSFRCLPRCTRAPLGAMEFFFLFCDKEEDYAPVI